MTFLVKEEIYSLVGFGVGLLLRRLGDRDFDLLWFLDPEEDLDKDLALILLNGLFLGLGDFDTDLEGERRAGFATCLAGGDLDLDLGCSDGGKALVLVSLGSLMVSFPSTFISLVSFLILCDSFLESDELELLDPELLELELLLLPLLLELELRLLLELPELEE